MSDSIPDGSRRQEFIDGLHAMAVYLTANPEVPDNGGHGIRAQYSVSVWFKDEAAGVAEVDRVAKVLGVGTAWNAERDHYEAELAFGPHTYTALWIRREIEEASE